ncbi:response regulator [Chryseosolibacter indicus]|uniref:Response regulator n=1 Tax=Chryseosolibacter indicus TaxID=2782351 RepID=A0ABS5VV34_9BACT|nr:response regulator [Chryseosolibacter indicus]MBT1705071.1 response regulator [Chryseosolibacter indicus]
MTKDIIHKVILLADDDLDDAEMFADVLAEIDSTVELYHVPDGFAVFEWLKNPANPVPDIIFLDINMPQITGWQCLSSLKADELTKDIPVLIYSTSSHHKDKQTAIDLGATAFITKPSDYKILEDFLTAIVNELHNKDIASIIRRLSNSLHLE